ncbi:hypothetical protein [Nitratifractor sp.]
MKVFWRVLVVLSIGLGATACMEKETVPQEGIFVVWKTPVMKYADQGFLYHEKEKLRLEIYASGQPVMQLTVTPTQVCTSGLCMSKEQFNLRYLSPDYPKDTLEKILNGEPVFGGEGMERKREGFTQRVKKAGRYEIEYSVLNGSIVFRDTINQILIKIQKRG